MSLEKQNQVNQRLANELSLLYRAEAAYKVPAAPVVRQLVADDERPLPDVLPPRPMPMKFQWPESGVVDFNAYWRRDDTH